VSLPTHAPLPIRPPLRPTYRRPRRAAAPPDLPYRARAAQRRPSPCRGAPTDLPHGRRDKTVRRRTFICRPTPPTPPPPTRPSLPHPHQADPAYPTPTKPTQPTPPPPSPFAWSPRSLHRDEGRGGKGWGWSVGPPREIGGGAGGRGGRTGRSGGGVGWEGEGAEGWEGGWVGAGGVGRGVGGGRRGG